MKYIVWDLISPHDGYGITECATWNEAAACVKARVEQPGCRRNQEVKTQYKQWLAGEINKIYVLSGRGRSQSVDIEIFITSEPLTAAIE